jgi:hypothetical protein
MLKEGMIGVSIVRCVLERGGQIERVANLKEIFVRVAPPLVNEYCQVCFKFCVRACNA